MVDHDQQIDQTIRLSPQQQYDALATGPVNMVDPNAPLPQGFNALFSSDEDTSGSEEEEDRETTRPLGDSTILRVGGPVRKQTDSEAQEADTGKGKPTKKISVRQYQERQARKPVTIPLGAPRDPRLARPYTIPRRTDSAPSTTTAPGV